MPSAGSGKGAPLSLPAIVPLIRITPASTAELTSATVRKIAVIRLILLMLFIILVFFLVLAFRDFSLLSHHFWPFTGVLRKIFGSLTRKWLRRVKSLNRSSVEALKRRDRGWRGCHE